jgi:hypothetical protein
MTKATDSSLWTINSKLFPKLFNRCIIMAGIVECNKADIRSNVVLFKDLIDLTSNINTCILGIENAPGASYFGN